MTRLSVCGLGVSCNEMSDTPMLLVVGPTCRVFTKHIDGMHNLSYAERLKSPQIYSLQRRRDRYMAIYMWKILERSAQLLATHSVPYISSQGYTVQQWCSTYWSFRNAMPQQF